MRPRRRGAVVGMDGLPGIDDAVFEATEDERLVWWLVDRHDLDEETAREEIAGVAAHLRSEGVL